DDVDLFEAANRLKEEQKTWLINLIGLIPNFNGLEVESQRYAVAAWKLIRELVHSPTKAISMVDARLIIGNSRYLKKLDHDGIIMILKKVDQKLEETDKNQRIREIIW
ncbi:19515_t:CDS:2, partial [Entrophospora sp. SA101]